MEHNPPASAADPRDGEPFYIDNQCPECSSELVLHDVLHNDELDHSKPVSEIELNDDEQLWHDEWECPNCQDGIYLDVPEEFIDELVKRAEDSFNGETADADDIVNSFLETNTEETS